MQNQARPATLFDALIPGRNLSVSRSLLRDVLLVVGFSAVIALSARIAVFLPFTPVPTQVCGGSPTAASYVTFRLPKPIVTVTVTGSPFPYDGNYHPVTSKSAVGLHNALLPVDVTYTDSNGQPVSPAPRAVGVYTATATFYNNGVYRTASAAAPIIIQTPSLPTPVITVGGGPFTYTGNPQQAVVTSSPSVSPITCTYIGSTTPPTNVGTYDVRCEFLGDLQYAGAVGPGVLVITKANPVMTATGGTFVYNGDPRPGSGSAKGAQNESLTPVTLSYSTPDGLPPREVIGTFTLTVSYAGSQNYTAGSATASITLTPATPTVAVNGATCTFTGAPCPATGTALGVNGVPLSFLLTLTYMDANSQPVSEPTAIGVYTVTATFNEPGPSHNSRYVTVTGLGAIVTIRGTAVPTTVNTRITLSCQLPRWVAANTPSMRTAPCQTRRTAAKAGHSISTSVVTPRS